MIQKGLWQERTIQNLSNLLEANEAVRALLLKGSSANPSLQVDTWSDVDVTIIVADGTLEAFFPTTVWLIPLGDVYTFSQSSNEHTKTTRVCFTDFRRIDCTFVQETDFQTQTLQGEAIKPLFCCVLVHDQRRHDGFECAGQKRALVGEKRQTCQSGPER